MPYELHCLIASFVLIALSHPIRYENGNDSLEKTTAEHIWNKICYCLNNEKNVRVYEECIKKIRSLARDDDEAAFYNWWSTFWNAVTLKVPDVAADYIEDFFIDAIDRKQTSILGLLNVRRFECIEDILIGLVFFRHFILNVRRCFMRD